MNCVSTELFYFTQTLDNVPPFLQRIVPVCYDSTWFCPGCLDPVGKHSPLVNVYWIECVFTVLLWDQEVLTYVTHNSFYSSCRAQTDLCVCVCLCYAARMSVSVCVHVCVGICQIPRMQVLFITFLVCVGKPKLYGTVGCTCCSLQPIQRLPQTEN